MFIKKQIEKGNLSKPQLNYQMTTNCVKTKLQGIDVYTPYQPYQTQKTYMSYVIKCLNNKHTGIIQSPTGTGKTISLLASTIAWQYHNHQKFYPNVPQIYYTSRTHQQLKQTINELKKLPYFIKSTVMSSRQHSCINIDLKELTGKDKGFQCRKRITRQQGKECVFYKNQNYYQEMKQSTKIKDLDQIIFQGKCEKFCPYFYTKTMKNSAHIIFMPYNYLFQQHTFQQNGFNLKNAILIIDQAHNIQQALQQSRQYSLTLNYLGRALAQISQLHEEKLTQIKAQKSLNSERLSDIQDFGHKKKRMIVSSIESIQYHASYVTMVHYHFQTIDIPIGTEGKTFSIKEFIEIIEKATQDSQFGVITKKLPFITKQLKNLRDDLKFRPFWALYSWADFIQKISELQKIYDKDKYSSQFRIQILYEGSDIKMNIYCLDPSQAMQLIMEHKPHSVILTSGTLSPIKSFTMELKLTNVEPASCPHIIEPAQAKAYIVTKGPNMKLKFSYENRGNKQMYNQLGLLLTQIIKHTKNGVVVFFPSYQLLQDTVKNLNAAKLLAKIYEHKTLHIESRDNSQFSPTLEKYMKEAQTTKGSVLFALIRGKISQGLDFADEKCRAVVIVGVPYPARKDIKVVAKIQYLNELASKQGKDVLNGQKWYLSQAIRSINQGIGRIIRHKKDYGMIYLLDERYDKEKPDLKSQISSWARASLTVINNYYDLAEDWRRKEEEFMLPGGMKDSHKGAKKPLIFDHFKSFSGSLKTPVNQNSLQSGNEPQQPEKLASLKEMIEDVRKNQQQKNAQQQIQISQAKENAKQLAQKEQQNFDPINPTFTQQQKPTISRQQQIFGKTKISFDNKEKIVPIDMLEECPICKFNKRLIKNTECIHKICKECWQEWLVKDLRCPFCRIRIRLKYLKLQA